MLLYSAETRLFFIRNTNVNFVPNVAEMFHISSTDHKAVFVSFNFESFPRGIGLWKFNDNLLEDDLFVEHLSSYILSYYESLLSKNVFSSNMIWDLVKIGIKDECIAYFRNKKVAEIGCDINRKIKELNDILTQYPREH